MSYNVLDSFLVFTTVNPRVGSLQPRPLPVNTAPITGSPEIKPTNPMVIISNRGFINRSYTTRLFNLQYMKEYLLIQPPQSSFAASLTLQLPCLPHKDALELFLSS